MGEYTDDGLLEMMKQAGLNPGDSLTDGAVSPSKIMGEAKTQGLHIPVTAIAAFLFGVFKGMLTKPLPQAVADCFKSVVGGGGSVVSS